MSDVQRRVERTADAACDTPFFIFGLGIQRPFFWKRVSLLVLPQDVLDAIHRYDVLVLLLAFALCARSAVAVGPILALFEGIIVFVLFSTFVLVGVVG